MSKIKELISERDNTLERIALLKADLQNININIDDIVGEKFKKLRQEFQKDTGTVNLKIDGVEVKQDIPKQVKWDQVILKDKYTIISECGDNPDDYISLSYKISESVYSALSDKEKTFFDKARTVQSGKPKLSFKAMEA